MNKKTYLKIFSVCLFALYTCPLYSSIETFERYSSAESLALGQHQVAMSRDISGLLYNPAGLAYVQSRQFLTAYSVIDEKNILLHLSSAMPAAKYRSIALMGSAAYYNSDLASSRFLFAATGFGFSKNMIKSGTYISFLGDLATNKIDRNNVFMAKTAGLLTPGIFRVGLVLSVETLQKNPPVIQVQNQFGFKLPSEILRLSAGWKKNLRKSNAFTFNGAIEIKTADFITLGMNIENSQIAGGIFLSSSKVHLDLAVLYDINLNVFNYSISLNSGI